MAEAAENHVIKISDEDLCILARAVDRKIASSNGAEGDPCPYCQYEMHGADDCEKCGMGSPARPARATAPPQPAPDATRSMDAKIARVITRLENYAHDLDCTERPATGEYDVTKDIRDVIQVLVDSFSAPVPSPDARLLEKLAQHFQSGKYGQDRYLFPDEIASEVRSFSGTGAAEPDWAATAQEAKAASQRVLDDARVDPAAKRVPVMSVAPPVRGDREAIAKIAEQIVEICRECRLGKTQASVDYNFDNSRAQCIKFVTNLLSLPSAPVSDDPLADLVWRFSRALLAKLHYARGVKGRSGWDKTNWVETCQRDLSAHVAKGDPLDVAAYTAFCWHHGWSTAVSTERRCPLCHGEGVLPPDGGGCERCEGSGKVPAAPVSGRDAVIEDVTKILETRASGFAARGNTIFSGAIIAEELRSNIEAIRALSNHKESGR